MTIRIFQRVLFIYFPSLLFPRAKWNDNREGFWESSNEYCGKNSKRRKCGGAEGGIRKIYATYRWDESENGPVARCWQELSRALRHRMNHKGSWKAESKVGLRSRQVSSTRIDCTQGARTTLAHPFSIGRYSWHESRHLTAAEIIYPMVSGTGDKPRKKDPRRPFISHSISLTIEKSSNFNYLRSIS